MSERILKKKRNDILDHDTWRHQANDSIALQVDELKYFSSKSIGLAFNSTDQLIIYTAFTYMY